MDVRSAEVRTIEEVKVWRLYLNRMTAPKIEMGEIAAWSTDRNRLIEFYNSQKVEPYTDGRWAKCFAKDGPLEWFNPMGKDDGEPDFFGHGISYQWVTIDVLNDFQMLCID